MIAECIKTRNCTQIRSHAQKYFIKQFQSNKEKNVEKQEYLESKNLFICKSEMSTQYGEDMLFPIF